MHSPILHRPPTLARGLALSTTQKLGFAAACLALGASIFLVYDLGQRPSPWASVSHLSPSHHGFPPTLVLLCSHRTRVPIAVAKLGWGSQVGMGCACSVSSGGARQPRPQASQAWLRHPVFQAQARGEGGEGRAGERGEGKREELGKGREGKGGEGEGQSGPLCVCVFVCVHTWGAHTMCHLCV